MEFILGMVAMLLIALVIVVALVVWLDIHESQKTKQYAKTNGWSPMASGRFFKVYDTRVRVETSVQGSKHVPVMYVSANAVFELPELSTKREVMQLADWLMEHVLNSVPQGQPITREVVQEIYTRASRPQNLSKAGAPPTPNEDRPDSEPASREYRRMLADKDR